MTKLTDVATNKTIMLNNNSFCLDYQSLINYICGVNHAKTALTIEEPFKIVADDILKFFFLFFFSREIKAWHFM